jgi:YHS domain-containing protein
MKVRYFAAIATVALIGFGWGITSNASTSSNKASDNSSVQRVASCAGKVEPCAAKPNPCAGKVAPCAAKPNPCAGKEPKPTSAKTYKHPKTYTEKGVALDGQDVVAYFTQNKLVQGNKSYTYQWNDATWQFSNAEHRDLFAKNPEKYAPAYGGYCAKAASDGALATTIPTAWEIRGGKLYLNYSAEAQKEWREDTANKIVRADKNWPTILNNDVLYE